MSNCHRSTTSLVSLFMMMRARESSLPARIHAAKKGRRNRTKEVSVFVYELVRFPSPLGRAPCHTSVALLAIRDTPKSIPRGDETGETRGESRLRKVVPQEADFNSPCTCFITFCTYFSSASSALVNNVNPYFLTCLKSSGGYTPL